MLTLSPLRERKQDIPLLVQHFIQQLSEQMGREAPAIAASTMDAIRHYHFPGNVRELRNLIEFALIASRGQPIQPDHLHFMASLALPDSYPTPVASAVSPEQQPDQNDESRLLQQLQRQGRIDNASAQRLLDIDHGRASYLLKKLHKEGKLVKQGERRWAYYTLPDV